MQQVEEIKNNLEELLLSDFKDKPITPEVLEQVKARTLGYLGIEGPSVGVEAVRGRDANEVSIVPRNMYTFVLMCGLETPPDNMPEDMREYSGERAIYRLYDAHGNKNPMLLPKVTLTHVTVTVNLKDEESS